MIFQALTWFDDESKRSLCELTPRDGGPAKYRALTQVQLNTPRGRVAVTVEFVIPASSVEDAFSKYAAALETAQNSLQTQLDAPRIVTPKPGFRPPPLN
jgi:hypothetical protein